MYRDEPLTDEEELRGILGDAAVDELVAADDGGVPSPLEVAIDVMRLLQGWVDDDRVGRWFTQPQHRLDGRSPLQALCEGHTDVVLDAARRWVAAQG